MYKVSRLFKAVLLILLITQNPLLQAKAKNFVEKEAEVEVENNEETLDFVFNEVLPAFGGWEMILSEFPEFEISYNSNGMKINSCNLSVGLKQVRPISLELLKIEGYEFNSDAKVGDNLKMHGNVYCGDENTTDTMHAVINFGFTSPEDITIHKQGYLEYFSDISKNAFVNPNDSVKKNTHYPLKLQAMGKRLFDLKIYHLKGDIKMITKTEEYYHGIDGDMKLASLFTSVKEDGDVLSISQKDWLGYTHNSERMEVRKVVVVSKLVVDMKLKISLPITDEEGERVHVPGTGSLDAIIYTTDEGESIPVMSIPLKKD